MLSWRETCNANFLHVFSQVFGAMLTGVVMSGLAGLCYPDNKIIKRLLNAYNFM